MGLNTGGATAALMNRCGKAPTEPEVSLRAAKSNTPVYISRLHYTTKVEDIVEYVRQKMRYTPRVQLLESHRNFSFKSFVVCVPNSYLPVVIEEDFWPQETWCSVASADKYHRAA